tara:strand:+ start:50 stop:484 length:435 start_codon:yes stop_codon:yes gene_type:complete
MHKGKKHTESSYQPIKDKGGKVILTSKQARDVDEDHHEFDHQPSQSDVDKANFINSKMKKMRKKSQGRKAVKDANKAINSIKSPINHQIAHKHSDGSKHGYIKPAVAKKSPMNMLGMGVSRCWKGYKPNPDGRPASEKGSCVKK